MGVAKGGEREAGDFQGNLVRSLVEGKFFSFFLLLEPSKWGYNVEGNGDEQVEGGRR